MEKIRIVYIDDSPDPELSKYLSEEYKMPDYEIISNDILFKPEDEYSTLLNNELLREANIVLLDSQLFEHGAVNGKKFKGEELKLAINRFYPFIEVIIITQNPPEYASITLSKYKHDIKNSPSQYYSNNVPPQIKKAIDNISMNRSIMHSISENNSWDPVICDKISNSIDGITEYSDLTKNDIDNLIKLFNNIEELLKDE